MSDPNGWVTQPPATMVKVVNTSRETLNGKLGIVLAYQTDRGRYVVLMTTSQEQVSLKADNLRKGSWMEQLQAQYELLQNNPQVQQQVRQIYQQVQQTTGVKPEFVAVAVGVALLAAIYFFGFSRVVMVLSFVLLCGILVQPDIAAGPRQMMRNAPRRFKDLVRQNVPVVGHRIANSDILTGLVAGVMLFFFVNALVGGGGGSSAKPMPLSSSGATSTARRVTTDRDLLQDYYKMGFDDATAGKEFGTSLPAVVTETPKGVDTNNPEDSWPGYNDAVPSRSSLLSKFTNLSTMISLYVVGSTIWNAGRTADGTGFDVQLAVANIRMLDVWKQGMLALSVYRLVSAFFT